MSRPTQLVIDVAALKHNFLEVQKLASGKSIIAMVKSNAYGHGIDRIARALQQADAFGVASLEEGLQLRHSGITQPIVLMEGLFNADELDLVTEHRFQLVIHEQHQVQALENFTAKYPIPIWLKIDTGMHRLGFDPDKFSEIYARLLSCETVQKPLNLMSHLAEADAVDRAFTVKQIELFKQLTQDLPGEKSLANSAGIIAWPSAHEDWVRPGLMLYGASPIIGHRGQEHHLKPVMSLTSELIAIHDLPQGARVGYGGTWTCPEAMRVGVVAIGYGDGYPRHVRNGVPVLLNNRPCPLIGRVSMDMLTIDLRTQPDAKIGDKVLLWGPGLPVEVVAEFSETTAYELLTRITQRVRVVTQDS